MKSIKIIAASVAAVTLFGGAAHAASVDIDLTGFSGTPYQINNIDVGGLASLSIDADTFDYVSSSPPGPRFTIELNGSLSSRIDANQGGGDAGLGAIYRGDSEDDIDGRGFNNVLLFNFDRVVTLTYALFDNDDNGDEFVFASGNSQPNVGQNFRAGEYDIFGLPGDDGYRNFNATGSFFAFGALSNGDDYRIKSLTVHVADVPLPAALPMLLAGMGGLAALRRRKKT